MRRRKGNVAQTRQIGDEGSGRHAAGQIVEKHNGREQAEILAARRQQGKGDIGHHHQKRAEKHRPHDADTNTDPTADSDTQQGRNQPDRFGVIRDLDFGEAKIDVEHTCHPAQHRIAELVENNYCEDE